MRAGAGVALALCCCLLPAARAQSLRCEDAAGKVTYSQGICPPGTRAVRTVEPVAPPSPQQSAAAEQRARGDAQALSRIEAARKAEEARRQPDRKPAADRTKQCRRLALRVRQARDDVNAAPLGQRAKAERRLQKAEENLALECPPTR